MDLKSREAAIQSIDDNIEAICEENDLTAYQEETASMCREWFVDEIAKVPSVPAVPLDKLCEWLADNYEPPANVSNGKALDDHEFCVTLWRYVLEKMMEGQDAAD